MKFDLTKYGFKETSDGWWSFELPKICGVKYSLLVINSKNTVSIQIVIGDSETASFWHICRGYVCTTKEELEFLLFNGCVGNLLTCGDDDLKEALMDFPTKYIKC